MSFKHYFSILIFSVLGMFITKISQAQVRFSDQTLRQIESLKELEIIRPMTFSKVSPGTYFMGTKEDKRYPDADELRREITLTEDFEIGQTEVTQFQWFEIMGENPSHFNQKENCPGHHAVFTTNGEKVPVCLNMPVEQVSWDDIQGTDKTQGFIQKLNALNRGSGYIYRLPSEAEWEYAARAGTETHYFCGDDESCLSSYAIFSLNEPGPQPAAVGSLLANAWGLFDMHGNVWEWVDDTYPNYYGLLPTVNPVNCPSSNFMKASYNVNSVCIGLESTPVIRGSSWGSDAKSLRSANRNFGRAGHRFTFVGFRLVRIAN